MSLPDLPPPPTSYFLQGWTQTKARGDGGGGDQPRFLTEVLKDGDSYNSKYLGSLFYGVSGELRWGNEIQEKILILDSHGLHMWEKGWDWYPKSNPTQVLLHEWFLSKSKIFPMPILATQTKEELLRFLQSLKIAWKSQQVGEKYNAKQVWNGWGVRRFGAWRSQCWACFYLLTLC